MAKLVSHSCPKCGAPIRVDREQTSAQCEYCGERFAIERKDAAQRKQQDGGHRHQPPPSNHTPFVIASVALVMVVGLVVAIFNRPPAPGTAAPSPSTNAATAASAPTPPAGELAKSDKRRYAPGEPISIKFSNIPETGAWISIAEGGSPSESYLTYQSVSQTSGELTFDKQLSPGIYELRIYFGRSGYDVRGSQQFEVSSEVEAPKNLVGIEDTYLARQGIEVAYEGMPSSGWIALAKAGASDTSYESYEYTRTKTGTVEFSRGLPAGDYEIRAYHDSGYEVHDRRPIRVVEATAEDEPPAGKKHASKPHRPTKKISVSFKIVDPGEYETALVQRILDRARNRLLPCYPTAPNRDDRWQDGYVVRVDANGSVASVSLRDHMRRDQQAGCARKVLESLKYPKTDNPRPERMLITLKWTWL